MRHGHTRFSQVGERHSSGSPETAAALTFGPRHKKAPRCRGTPPSHVELHRLLYVLLAVGSLLTGLAVEAAEPQVEVLLVLHARPVPPQRDVLVLVSGPLRRRGFGRVAHQPDEERRHQHQHLHRRGHGVEREERGKRKRVALV
ncbi:hypothetical protein EYF80_050712 [Liparis tanakae]|uniref:Uncharacterized protein n=1 Tax=Liparis tanakae TaxID=230148 RepID=A0A4Z2FD48_9TELE|nr:hypothetical protein EYF80_050712 [Liparis tanakae]